MTPRHLYTIRWTQPYATDRLRPYLRHLQEELEQVIETLLEHKQFDDAKVVIDRIRAL
jgi:hypothetical protein